MASYEEDEDFPPFFEVVKDVEGVNRLINKIVHHFWWTIIIERMKYMNTYARLLAYEKELERWQYLSGTIFDELMESPLLEDDPNKEFDVFKFFFMKFIQNISKAMGMSDDRFINFCTTILEQVESDTMIVDGHPVKGGLNGLLVWVASHIQNLKSDYLQGLHSEECTVEQFDEWMEKEVEKLCLKSIDETPFQKVHARLFIAIAVYFSNKDRQSLVESQVSKALKVKA